MTWALAAGLAAVLTAPADYQQSDRQKASGLTQGLAAPAAPDISGFSVVLVVGETQPSAGASAVQEVPPGAQQALNDMRDFLPYKHYRVLDTQWTSCCSPKSQATVSGRLQGVSVSAAPGSPGAVNLVSRSYAFSITARTASPTIGMQFVLAVDDPGRHVSPERVRELAREREDLRAEIELVGNEIASLQRRVEVGAVSGEELPPLKTRHASLQRRLADLEKTQQEVSTGGQRPIVDSSFTMAVGETVVVGTSRLGGDKALIALVTAVKKR